MAEGHKDEIDRSEESHVIANPMPSMQGASDITQNNEGQIESLNPSFAGLRLSQTQPLPLESLATSSQALEESKSSYISSQQANLKSDVKHVVFHQPANAVHVYNGPVYNVANGKNSIYGNVSESQNVMNSLKADSQKEDGGMLPSAKSHQNVLNRCLPALLRNLDFRTVSIYIQQNEVLDDLIIWDILEQKTTSDKIGELIQQIKKRDKDVYGKFKECLVQAQQTFLRDILEEEEIKEDKQCTAIPAEILRMNDQSIQLFKEAMKDGEAKVYNVRVMVVGHLGVGKTTLIKRFLEKEVNIDERQSTEGIVVHVHCCKVSQDGSKWTLNEGDLEQNMRLQHLAKVLNDQAEKRKSTGLRMTQVETNYQRENKIRAGDHALLLQPVSQNSQTSSEPNQSNEQGVKEMESAADNISDDPAMEILKLLHANADKLKQETDIPLTMVDFAGHFAFYTTHQTFLTDRAIYLLVSDISKQITDPVEDECYFDMEGIKLCKVYELVEVWLNSIHSCAPYPGAKTPPVILVGTHVDQIQQDSREEVCQEYFRQIRCEYLGTKPTIVHLADEDFAIDNTVIDQKLDELKQKIIQLAREQPYWGQAIPVRWLTLEEHLMRLKAAGVKVIKYSLLEEMNQNEAVKIESREELDLFLKFQNDIGNILYFGTEGLKEQIMLDPQWFIYSLRAIITAEDFILKKIKTPAIIQKWREFKETGKLTQELIDAIWTKENHPDCHDNKDLILSLMEHLNIIARPQSFSKDGDEVKEESYFLAPCMLKQETPEEVICPKPNDKMENSSVLCYVFTGNFLPSPIFHRLVAACVAHWPVAKKKTEQKEENLIFCGCCIFQLDQQHKLTLHFRGHVIFLRVRKMSNMDKTPSSMLCMEVRKFVTTNLLNIIGYLGQCLKFEYFIQCPEYNGVSINSLIPESLLKENAEVHCDMHDHMIESSKVLDFWLEDQEQSGNRDASSAGSMPSAPISDKDRFMCIAYLLNDVGSKVLRQLFHDMVTPTYTLDQYLANNRSTINGLRKKKVLNVSQMDIMFPPNGDDTNLTDYDITLLSALFINIVPSLGHQEKNLIKSLRDNRNKLYGHTKSCKMNASDFQTYWSDISATLITLSQQCGDSKFKNEISMEIQQTQVPDVSYLSMIQTLYSRMERVEQRLESNKASATNET